MTTPISIPRRLGSSSGRVDDRRVELVHHRRPQEDRDHVRHDGDRLLRRSVASKRCSIRLQLARPDGTVLSAAAYNEFFTMHGTTMVFLMGMPIAAAFGNYLVPLMIGARDVAFPRLNMLGYWIFLFGGIFIYSSFILGFGGAPNGGWFGYAPLNSTPMSLGLPARPRPRLLGRRHHHARHRVGRDRGQLHRHDPQHARAGHDA